MPLVTLFQSDNNPQLRLGDGSIRVEDQTRFAFKNAGGYQYDFSKAFNLNT